MEMEMEIIVSNILCFSVSMMMWWRRRYDGDNGDDSDNCDNDNMSDNSDNNGDGDAATCKEIVSVPARN